MGLVLVRYGEIALKGRNQPGFLRRLRHNIRASLQAHGVDGQVVTRGQRCYVETETPEAALEPLSRVFGITSASVVESVAPDMTAITDAAVAQAARCGLHAGRTFRIRARRADKRFPLTSPEIERQIGARVVQQLGATVDLSRQADLTIGIEISRDGAFVYTETMAGLGGLPVGVEGRVVALLSGGLDSYAAAWLMLKRGCAVIPVHFAKSAIEREAVLRQIDELQRYCYGWYMRPIILDYATTIEPYLRRLHTLREERYTCTVCKHVMLAQAQELAREHDAHGLVVGDALGQVASQTLLSLEAVSHGISMPVFRPLIGMDKAEILSLAERAGAPRTESLSGIECPYLPPHPITRPTLERFAEVWQRLECVEETT